MEKKAYRLMFVDDEHWALIGLHDVIDWTAHGFEVAFMCHSAEEALEALDAETVDAVISDIHMDEMNGLDFIEQLRSRELAQAFVLLSAHREFEYARKAISQGVLHYLLKPLDAKEVSQMAQRLKEELDELNRRKSAGAVAVVDLADEESLKALNVEAAYPHCYLYFKDEIPEEWAHLAYSATAIFLAGVGHIFLLSSQTPLEREMPIDSRVGLSRRFSDFSAMQEMADSARTSRDWAFAYTEHPTTARIQQYLGTHAKEHIVIAEVAKAFFISDVYLSELFKRHTQLTVISFIRKIRLAHAKKLLRDTELSIKEVAEAVGYEDASYFGRQFKRESGCSPENFRQQSHLG